jgi:hypothetical protein
MIGRQAVDLADLMVAALEGDQGAGIEHHAWPHAARVRRARGRAIRARKASRSAAVGIELASQLAWSLRAASILRWS